MQYAVQAAGLGRYAGIKWRRKVPVTDPAAAAAAGGAGGAGGSQQPAAAAWGADGSVATREVEEAHVMVCFQVGAEAVLWPHRAVAALWHLPNLPLLLVAAAVHA